MTVASLWKALDRAGCGRAVGTPEIVNHNQPKKKITPWNYNQMKRSGIENLPTLAVDLSIWICESLTSTAMAQNHAHPALQLVYSRTVKLLNLGVKLVVVIEGKRRIRRAPGEEGEDKFRKRRSGTAFWKACQSCEEMLRLLGVPVVRAVAEGEALCALLNQKGIVDGVISNDGDCLLFGAKVIYTKFSIDNMDNSRVIRYDASEIKAFVDDNDDEGPGKDTSSGEVVALTRKDLIAFALLTGSDLAGNGLPKVGCRKALRFIRKCKIDNPLKAPEVAAIEELESWARSASVMDQLESSEEPSGIRERNCSCCCHPGTKLSHQKQGCKLCGTSPGEPCFRVSPGGRFRKSLRAKALAMQPKFDPTSVVSAYLRPNGNQIPFTLVGKTSQTLKMGFPRLQDMLQSSLIVRGRSYSESREYIRQSLARLAARTDLFRDATKGSQEAPSKISLSRDRPIPQTIKKKLVRDGTPSFEILWSVSATMTDEDGNCVDGYEFLTVESQDLIKKCHPHLIKSFEEQRKIQGDGEQVRRRAFLDSIIPKQDAKECVEESPSKKKRRQLRGRKYFFQSARVECRQGKPNPVCSRSEISQFPPRHNEDANQACYPVDSIPYKALQNSSLHLTNPTQAVHPGDKLASGPKQRYSESLDNQQARESNGPDLQNPSDSKAMDFDFNSIESGSCFGNCSESKHQICGPRESHHVDMAYVDAPLTPGHLHFLSAEGCQQVSEKHHVTLESAHGNHDPLVGIPRPYGLSGPVQCDTSSVETDLSLSPPKKRRRKRCEIHECDDYDQEESAPPHNRLSRKANYLSHNHICRQVQSTELILETSRHYFDFNGNHHLQLDSRPRNPRHFLAPGRIHERSDKNKDSGGWKQAQRRSLPRDEDFQWSAPRHEIDRESSLYIDNVESQVKIHYASLQKMQKERTRLSFDLDRECSSRPVNSNRETGFQADPQLEANDNLDNGNADRHTAQEMNRESCFQDINEESPYNASPYDRQMDDYPVSGRHEFKDTSTGLLFTGLPNYESVIRSSRDRSHHMASGGQLFDNIEAPLSTVHGEESGTYKDDGVQENGFRCQLHGQLRDQFMEEKAYFDLDHQAIHESSSLFSGGGHPSTFNQTQTLGGEWNSAHESYNPNQRGHPENQGIAANSYGRHEWLSPASEKCDATKFKYEMPLSNYESRDDHVDMGSSTRYRLRPTRRQEFDDQFSTCSFSEEMCDFERHLLQTHEGSDDFCQREEVERALFDASPKRLALMQRDEKLLWGQRETSFEGVALGWDERSTSSRCGSQTESLDCDHFLHGDDHGGIINYKRSSGPWVCTSKESWSGRVIQETCSPSPNHVRFNM